MTRDDLLNAAGAGRLSWSGALRFLVDGLELPVADARTCEALVTERLLVLPSLGVVHPPPAGHARRPPLNPFSL